MKVATTVHKDGYAQYGYRWVESMANWPKAEFVMYSEGFDPPCDFKRVEAMDRLEAFKRKFACYVSPSWEFDIVRFSNKVFAAYDAFYDYDGLCVWLDADCVTYKKLPSKVIERQLPKDAFMAQFRRAGYHVETGMWLMDGKHPEKKVFLDTWVQWFETGHFKDLRQWHDCTTLDATSKLFERDGRVVIHNLSGEFSKDMHPMSKVELGKYIDHCKGRRKTLGFSPENIDSKKAHSLREAA
jgi:hypothetical protein